MIAMKNMTFIIQMIIYNKEFIMDIKRVERIERNKYKRKIKRYRKFARLRRNILYTGVKRNKS